MRIALQQTEEVGDRAGRILLGDRRVDVVGVVDREPRESGERIEGASNLTRYDLVVTDAADPEPMISRAAAAGISCVVWVDHDLAVPGPTAEGMTLLVGCNLASGIAPCLASHEAALAEPGSTISIAWTEPGTPLRSGEPLAFPDPVGGRWGRRRDSGDSAFVAPIAGEWAGAIATVGSDGERGRLTRIVGVADQAAHLEALALAAGALAVGAGSFAPGLRRPRDAAEQYLAEALQAGLDVAAHTMTEN